MCAPPVHGECLAGGELSSTAYIWSILVLKAARPSSLWRVDLFSSHVEHVNGARWWDTVYSLALILCNVESAESLGFFCLAKQPEPLRVQVFQKFLSSVHRLCQRRELINQPTSLRSDRSNGPLLVGCTRVIEWDVAKEDGKDLTVHLWTF